MKRLLASLEPGRLRAGAAAWLRERIDLGPALAWAAKKTVPIHRHSWMYLFGGAALFLFTLQVASGVLLMLYYHPTQAEAYESVETIMAEVPFGWLIRSVHMWGAHLFIGLVVVHLVAKVVGAAYRKPRELTWVTGLCLLGLVLASGFSGYLLPWNELSYYATLAGTQIPGSLPLVGDWLVHFLRGGDQITGDTITRFYAAHVLLLPLGYGGLLAVHLTLVQIQGQSLPLRMSPDAVRDRWPFFSEFMPTELCLWLVLFGLIATLSVLFPAETGVKADPLAPAPEGIRPEWYFLFLFQTFKAVPELVGIPLVGLVGLFLVLLPFLDRRASREQRRSLWLVAVFALLAGWVVAFEVMALAGPGRGHPPEAGAGGAERLARSLVSLALLWAVIGFMVYYLWQFARENRRIRRLYRRE
ncbi:MAG TPA: cytochrome bc complex cytochrome b subunit [Planctomycetaceae bacterium]|nr:cytochrome bc complex cytochrome b subunit [Planctomycetaceae bacterium]